MPSDAFNVSALVGESLSSSGNGVGNGLAIDRKALADASLMMTRPEDWPSDGAIDLGLHGLPRNSSTCQSIARRPIVGFRHMLRNRRREFALG